MLASTQRSAAPRIRLTVGSTFTGVGGADLGFEEAGFEISWQCELDTWKRQVLAAHWPSIPIYEDITELYDPAPVDVMIGGFPCQDLSIAGKRKGFDGERSVLAFEFLRLAESVKPRWIVLENVPGLLSSNKGLDFQRLLREVAACGYGVAYRCLDSRYFGVPQRRRRIFIVARRAEAGLDPRAASGLALLALCESGSGDLTPCVPSWQETARDVGASTVDGRVGTHGAVSDEPTGTLTRMYSEQSGQDYGGGQALLPSRIFNATAQFGAWREDEKAHTLTRRDHKSPNHLISFYSTGGSQNGFAREDGVSPTLKRGSGLDISSPPAIAYRKSARVSAPGTPETWVDDGRANTLNRFDIGDVRTTHAVVEVASTLQGTGGCLRGQRNDAEGAAGGHLIPQTFPIDDGREIEKHQNGTGIGGADDPAYTLDRQQRPAVASVSPTLTKYNLDSRSPQSAEQQRIVEAVREVTTSVRRLTPIECERLMGWPDNWTAPEGIKAPDSRRYAACGDGIVANVAYWIAQRISMIETEGTK